MAPAVGFLYTSPCGPMAMEFPRATWLLWTSPQWRPGNRCRAGQRHPSTRPREAAGGGMAPICPVGILDRIWGTTSCMPCNFMKYIWY